MTLCAILKGKCDLAPGNSRSGKVWRLAMAMGQFFGGFEDDRKLL